MTTRATYRARRRANTRRTAEDVRFHQARLCVRLKANMWAYMHKHQADWFLRALEKAREAERSFDMGDVIYDDKLGLLPLGPRAKWAWPPPPQSFWDALNRMAAVLDRANHDHELPGEYDLAPKPKNS